MTAWGRSFSGDLGLYPGPPSGCCFGIFPGCKSDRTARMYASPRPAETDVVESLGDLVAWRWRSGVQSLAPRSPPQPAWQRHPCLISARGRRFGGLTSKCWGGLCGSSPSWRSRSALLRIAERWRCNRLAICEAEFVGHKVTSSRSSSSVQRGMADLGHGGPSAWCHACRFVWHHFGDCSLAASAKSEPLAKKRAPDNLSMRVIEFRVSAQWVLARIPLGEKSAGEFLARRPRRIVASFQHDSMTPLPEGLSVGR